MRSRADSLEFALLGLLSQSSLHGYELRKRMVAIFGPFRALSFSVLYPQLRRMVLAGLIESSEVDVTSRRTRIVYAITEKGKKRFEQLTETVTPEAWSDEGFEVHFALLAQLQRRTEYEFLKGACADFKRRLNFCVEISRDLQLGSTDILRSGAATHSIRLSERSLG